MMDDGSEHNLCQLEKIAGRSPSLQDRYLGQQGLVSAWHKAQARSTTEASSETASTVIEAQEAAAL